MERFIQVPDDSRNGEESTERGVFYFARQAINGNFYVSENTRNFFDIKGATVELNDTDFPNESIL